MHILLLYIAGSNGIMFEQDHLGTHGADVNDIE